MDDIIVGSIKLRAYKNKNGEIKVFILTGIDTYPFRNELRSLHGKWLNKVINPETKKMGVWGFSLKYLKDVIDWANSITNTVTNIEDNQCITDLIAKYRSPGDIKFLLYPFKYNIPTPKEIINSINEFSEVCIKQCKSNDEKSLVRHAFQCLEEQLFGEDELVIIYRMLDRYFNIPSRGDSMLTDMYKQLKYNLQDPVKNFILFLSLQLNTLISFGNIKFQKLFDEVVNDNIISEDEVNYLLEKADYYGIEKESVVRALENPKQSNSNFNYLINEACKSGKISSSDKRFILERAKKYNYTEEEVEKLLSERLNLYKLISQIANNELLADLVFEYLFISSLNIPKPAINVSSIDFTDKVALEDLLHLLRQIRANYLFQEFGLEVQDLKIKEILTLLEISIKEEVLSTKGNADALLITKENNLIFFKGFYYTFLFVETIVDKLFDYEIIGNKVIIKVNINSSFFTYHEAISRPALYLIISLIATRLENYSDKSMNYFFDLLELNQKHLNREIERQVV